MKKLIVASGNKDKISEIKQIIGEYYNIYSMKELGFDKYIEETGKTFLENALIKAKAVSEYFYEDALSDDSGLIVDALNGAPGIYSARYSGENATNDDNNKLLLKNLKNENNRKAEFFSCVVLYHTNGSYEFGEGRAFGRILYEERGKGGFGYDPLFFSDELKKSFGEALAEEKNIVSHRFKALMNLKSKLQGTK